VVPPEMSLRVDASPADRSDGRTGSARPEAGRFAPGSPGPSLFDGQ
jgi:hypothetical protein